MTIYIPLWENDPSKMGNPFVSTLTTSICNLYSDVDFIYDARFIMSSECENIDIIHVMWPDVFDYVGYKPNDLKNRLKHLKEKGIKIISTCHNMQPHYSDNCDKTKLYDIVYFESEYIIHLANYSKTILEYQYSHANHIIIPHHVYDVLYQNIPTRDDALRKLGFSSNKRYIICMGAFRDQQEKKLILDLGKKLRGTKIYILAPGYVSLPFYTKNIRIWRKPFFERIKVRYFNHIICKGSYVTDDELPSYYASSDVALIHRTDILNSGNLPLAMLMGKVVVGPDTGNVAEILQTTRNITFSPENNNIIDSIYKALSLAKEEHGNENRNYALTNWKTVTIAQKHYSLYKELLYAKK